ncbi:MAG: AAA family ATPase [Pseudonocardiaceae bacterium]|nr:AAA family ATPase [Pseudonocardiaceae bacterium]
MTQNWPLVGRRRELSLIDEALNSPTSQGLMLAGPIGTGRTRLAQEAVSLAKAMGAVTHVVHATSAAATFPFGAVAHLLPPASSSAVDPARLLHETVRHLVSNAGTHRIVLAVDDAHRLDEMSATLIHQLAATRSAFVVVSACTGTLVPEPIFSLWKDQLIARLDVPRLTRDETDELLTAALGGQVDGSTVHQLWKLTLGHPLFLRELVEGGLGSKVLQQSEEIWRWHGPVTASGRLVELIEARMGWLDRSEHMLMEMLSFGGDIGVEVLNHAGAGAQLAALERKGLVVSERLSRRVDVRLAHPLYGEVIRTQTPARRVRDVHRLLADVLAATPARRADDRPRIIGWRLEAGLATDVRSLLEAADRAIEARRYPLAQRLAQSAVERGGEFPALHQLGRALIGLGRYREAELVLAGIPTEDLAENIRAHLAATRATNLYWGLGQHSDAEAVLSDTEQAASQRSTSDEVATIRATFRLHQGDCAGGLAAVERILDRQEAGDGTILQALIARTQALSTMGRTNQAIATAERGLELERHVAHAASPWGHVQLEAGRCGAYAYAGRLGAAEALAHQGYQLSLDQDWEMARSLFATCLGHVNRMRGLLRSAQRWLREAAALETDENLFRPVILANLVMATAGTGDLPAAKAAQSAAERALLHSSRLYEAVAVIARTWVAAAAGETSRAVELALEAAELARSRGQAHFEIIALHDAVRLEEARTVVDALEHAGSVAEGILPPAYVAHGRAAADGDGAALDQVAETFIGIGANLLAAEAAAQAFRAYRAAGQAGKALAAATRARSWVQQCEGANTPALAVLDEPESLTPREAELARLAAAGLTSRAIAERLVISVRTVDNILHGVYTKLGIAGRRELPRSIGLIVSRVR